MKKLIDISICAIGLLIGVGVNAQNVIVLESIPSSTPPDEDIYLAGNLNDWNPGDENYKFEQSNELLWLSLPDDSPLVFQGKFTRGSWPTVEGNANGSFLPNRTFDFTISDTLYLEILSWEDTFVADDLPDNLVIISEDFEMPELDRTRRIRVLLPGEYDETNLDYPVLYMHDGQNLFSASESFAGEWEVDEALASFEMGGYDGCILVAIDNGGADRIAEYTPWANPQYGGGEGDAYMNFIVNTLKPYVDENFRTLPERDHTGIMGSSLGGLISHYGALAHPNVFSKVGVFSPSFWFTEDIYEFTAAQSGVPGSKFFFLAGGQESASLEAQVNEMVDLLLAIGFEDAQLRFDFVENGQHSEWFWAQEFPTAFDWLYLNDPLNASFEDTPSEPILFPNPALDILFVYGETDSPDFSADIYDISGRHIGTRAAQNNRLDISDLESGIYNLVLSSSTYTWVKKIVKK